MKKLALNGVRPPLNEDSAYTKAHFYTVHLGNGIMAMFRSERAALALQAETDRWISAHLADANFLLAEAFVTYRNAWLLLPVGKTETEARELMQAAWRGLDMAVVKCKGPSGWTFGWRFLRDAVASIRKLALLLRDLFRARNHPVERARMELLIERSTRILNDMKDYGADAKGAVITRP